MPHAKITRDFVRRLTPPPRETFWWDSQLPGFGIRSYPSGSHHFVIQYTDTGNRTHRQTLCRVDQAVSLDQVRTRARSALTDAALVRAHVKPLEQESPKIGELIDPWLARKREQRRRKTVDEYERHLKKLVKQLHGFEARRLTRHDVAGLLERVRQRHGRTTANRVRATMSSFCSWMIEKGHMDVSPVIGTTVEEETPRDRVLELDELASVWHAATPDYAGGALVRSLILTGLRRGELAGLRGDEIGLDLELLFLPADRVKNGRNFVSPLSKTAVEILLPRAAMPYTFGRTGPFSGFSRLLTSLRRRSGVDGWSMHDLRRSFATHANRLKLAPPHVVEAQLNHISTAASAHRGVAGIYNRADYLEERRQLLDRWSETLMDAVYRRREAD